MLVGGYGAEYDLLTPLRLDDDDVHVDGSLARLVMPDGMELYRPRYTCRGPALHAVVDRQWLRLDLEDVFHAPLIPRGKGSRTSVDVSALSEGTLDRWSVTGTTVSSRLARRSFLACRCPSSSTLPTSVLARGPGRHWWARTRSWCSRSRTSSGHS